MNNDELFHKLIFIDKMFKKRNSNSKNITHGQGRILAILNHRDGLSTKELSEILNIKVTSLNETLNKLIKAGYVKKETSPEDKRVLLVYLTEKGHEFKLPMPKDLDVFDCLDESEKENLDRYLTKIAVAFHSKLKEENPERYEKMLKHRQEVLEKYFGCELKQTEWFRMIEKN